MKELVPHRAPQNLSCLQTQRLPTCPAEGGGGARKEAAGHAQLKGAWVCQPFRPGTRMSVLDPESGRGGEGSREGSRGQKTPLPMPFILGTLQPARLRTSRLHETVCSASSWRKERLFLSLVPGLPSGATEDKSIPLPLDPWKGGEAAQGLHCRVGRKLSASERAVVSNLRGWPSASAARGPVPNAPNRSPQTLPSPLGEH